MENKYEQFAKLVEDNIRDGEFCGVDFLPSERGFTIKYGISRVAVRMGLTLLKNRGIIESVPGKGYRLANGKKTDRQSELIGIVFGSPLNETPAVNMADGISSIFHQHGKHMIYTNCMGSIQRQKVLVNSLLKRGVDGLIVVPMYRLASVAGMPDSEGTFGFLKKIHDNGIPVVLVDRSFSRKGLPCVSNDDVAIGYMGTKHLIDHGHKKIIFFSPVKKNWVTLKRFKGYRKAIEDYKLNSCVYSLDHLDLENLNRKIIIKEIKTMLNKFPDADAIQTIAFFPRMITPIIKSNNYLGSIKECIGVDYPPESQGGVYPYIERPIEKIGQLAAEKMIKILNKDIFTAEELIKPEIINPKSEPFYHEEMEFALAY